MRVSGAAAEITAHVLADIGIVRRMPLPDAGNRREDLARRAIAALERVLIDERLLHRMELAVDAGEAFDRDDRAAHRYGERHARQHTLLADMDGTCAALAVIAALLGPGEGEMLAQRIEQGCPRIQFQPVL